MSAELYEAVARIARHCWMGAHWDKTPNGPRPVREPLKKKHLERHCNGGAGVGLAPIAPGESTCRIAVLDFDSHKGGVPWEEMVAKARELCARLTLNGFAPIPFRSSGGKGIHLIMLWDEPQDAYSVRERIAGALPLVGLKSGTKGVKHGEVEIFPKQDSVPADGLGNMFVLPLTGESLPLDPVTLELLDYGYAEDLKEWPKSKPVQRLPRPDRQPVQTSSSIDPASLATILAELTSALAAIPNEGEGLSYGEWFGVICGIHHATEGSAEGLALAQEFSARSGKHVPEFLDERVWPYVRSDRGGAVITAASVFNRARQHGWEEDVASQFEDLGTLQPEEEQSRPRSNTAATEQAAARSEISRFAVQPLHVFANRAHPGWIVRHIMPNAEVMLIIGESGAGKSFLAFDLSAAIAQGVSWRTYKTKKGRVVYVIAEGASFFHQRAVAYARHYNLSLDALQIGVVSNAPNLLLKEDLKSLIDELRRDAKANGRAAVIVIDTFAQVTPGANENAAEDMGRALAHCKTLHQVTGALIVLVHHVGKDETKGARGWSGIKAAADAEITVTRREPQRIATVSKMKDGPDGLVLPFKLVDVEIGKDDEGERITSCIVSHVEAPAGAMRRQPSGPNARIVLNAAQTLAALDSEVSVGDVLALAAQEMTHDPESKRDRRRELAVRALDGLKEQGYLRIEDGRVLVPEEA